MADAPMTMTAPDPAIALAAELRHLATFAVYDRLAALRRDDPDLAERVRRRLLLWRP